MFTDHEALNSLLHNPHPSGKFATWRMTLQELDLQIEYRPRIGNQKADALSRYPVSLLSDDIDESTPVVVAAIEASANIRHLEDEEDITLSKKQRWDPIFSQ